MKKATIFIILLVIILVIAGKAYIDSRVRTDIKDNVKKYNEQLIGAVKDLKETGNENKKLSNDVYDFIGKYYTTKTTKKEKDLLMDLMSVSLDYMQMMDAKKENRTDAFNDALQGFENDSTKIKDYYKK